jgi:hypothetical protein
MNPYLNEELFDAITLAGVKSPGKVTLSGHKRAEKWDVKEGDGQDGASTTRKGKELAKFTATFELLYDPTQNIDEFESWDSFLKVLRRPVASKDPVALDIYHPDLAELDIKSVVVVSIGGKNHSGKGSATVAVEFLEYSPPKPKKAKGAKGGKTSNGGKTGGGANAQVDPNEAAKRELANLLNEAKKP